MEKDARIPEKESYAYYKRVLETGEHIAYLMMVTEFSSVQVVSVSVK